MPHGPHQPQAQHASQIMAPTTNDNPNALPTPTSDGYKKLFMDRFAKYSSSTAATGLFYKSNTGQPSCRIEATEIRMEFVDVAEFGTGERRVGLPMGFWWLIVSQILRACSSTTTSVTSAAPWTTVSGPTPALPTPKLRLWHSSTRRLGANSSRRCAVVIVFFRPHYPDFALVCW